MHDWLAAAILRVLMRRLSSIVAVLLLLTAAAPVMACLTSVAMSQEESTCCHAMHGQCGHMEKMGCCRTEVRTDVALLIIWHTSELIIWRSGSESGAKMSVTCRFLQKF
jgi:hypothetical protein